MPATLSLIRVCTQTLHTISDPLPRHV